MKPAVLTASILGAFAIAAITSVVASPSSPVSTTEKTSATSEPDQNAPAPTKTGAVAVLDTGRPPVPIVRPPMDPARIPPAVAPPSEVTASTSQVSDPVPPTAAAPSASEPDRAAEVPPLSVPSGTLPRDPSTGGNEMANAEQRLQSALALLPRGPDVRYWIVPMDDGRIRVVAERKGDLGLASGASRGSIVDPDGIEEPEAATVEGWCSAASIEEEP